MRTPDSLYSDIMVFGGALWDDTDELPFYGYLVALGEYSYSTDVFDFGPDVVEAYLATTPLPQDGYYGAFIDGDRVHLSVSLHATTKAEAHVIADLEDQEVVVNLYDQKVEATA
jgi:hypothetical protein